MLTRWDPFQEMWNLRSAVDRLFDSSLGLQSGWQQPEAWGLALDIVENKDEFLVKASLPGMNPDDLEITYTQNLLTIKGELKAEEEVKDAQYHLRERRYGSFTRSVTLPAKVNAEKIDAKYENGVLTLHLPKAEEVKPKRISIHASSPKVIEGKVSERK
jgi:HSP20 family protein